MDKFDRVERAIKWWTSVIVGLLVSAILVIVITAAMLVDEHRK